MENARFSSVHLSIKGLMIALPTMMTWLVSFGMDSKTILLSLFLSSMLEGNEGNKLDVEPVNSNGNEPFSNPLLRYLPYLVLFSQVPLQ